MTKEYSIIWQKWQDPFGENEETDNYDNFFEHNDDANQDSDLINEYQENNKPYDIVKKQVKVIATPMGIVPINENTASGKIFNFWLGHTNFDITSHIFKIIELTEGVETLDIFTRYRFRISIGKAFTDSTVMKDIQDSIYAYIDETTNDN